MSVLFRVEDVLIDVEMFLDKQLRDAARTQKEWDRNVPFYVQEMYNQEYEQLEDTG